MSALVSTCPGTLSRERPNGADTCAMISRLGTVWRKLHHFSARASFAMALAALENPTVIGCASATGLWSPCCARRGREAVADGNALRRILNQKSSSQHESASIQIQALQNRKETYGSPIAAVTRAERQSRERIQKDTMREDTETQGKGCGILARRD